MGRRQHGHITDTGVHNVYVETLGRESKQQAKVG